MSSHEIKGLLKTQVERKLEKFPDDLFKNVKFFSGGGGRHSIIYQAYIGKKHVALKKMLIKKAKSFDQKKKKSGGRFNKMKKMFLSSKSEPMIASEEDIRSISWQRIVQEKVILEKIDEYRDDKADGQQFIVLYYGNFQVKDEAYFVFQMCVTDLFYLPRAGDRARVDENKLTPYGFYPYPAKTMLLMISPIIAAVAFLNSHGIIHRDIKESNILVDKKGVPKLSDFGLARCLDTKSGLSKFTEDDFVGTECYVAPEIVLEKDFDEKIDSWSLAVTMQSMITGWRENESMYLHLPWNTLVEIYKAADKSEELSQRFQKKLFAARTIGWEDPKKHFCHERDALYEYEAFSQPMYMINPSRRATATEMMHTPTVQKYLLGWNEYLVNGKFMEPELVTAYQFVEDLLRGKIPNAAWLNAV